MTMDVKTSVNLDILRGEMEYLVNAGEDKMTTASTFEEEPNNGRKKCLSVEEEYNVRLQQEFEEKREEQEKWERLSGKLVKKAKEMEDKVMRITASAKVFQEELQRRKETLDNRERKLQEKIADAQRQVDSLKEDRQRELDHAAYAKRTAEEADGRFQENKYELEELKDEYWKAIEELKKSEDRVQDLQINLQGNNSLSGNQREYMKAECQMERDLRDKCRAQVDELKESHEGLKRSCKNLRSRKFLFQDEHRRRLAKAEALKTKIEEQQESNFENIGNFRQEVEKVRAGLDAWEEKTFKLVKEAGPTREHLNKLKVKARLFRWQLEEANTALKRMEAKVAMWQGDLRGIKTNLIRDAVHNKSESSKSDLAQAEPKAGASAGKASVKEKVQVAKWRPALSTYKASNNSIETASPPTAKTKHIEHTFQSTPSSYGEDKNPKEKFEVLQQDLQNQKCILQDYAWKTEQQLVNLAFRIEAHDGGPFGKAQTIDTQGDQDVRLLFQQLNKQCIEHFSKLAGLDKVTRMREEQHATLERSLEDKERLYIEIKEFIKSEIEQKLKNRQTVLFDKMNESLSQKQEVVSSFGSRRGNFPPQDSTGSLVSLESLQPFESPCGRQAQVRFVEVPDPTFTKGDELSTGSIFAPNGGLAMTSGTMMNSPLYKNISAAFQRGRAKPPQ